jgi:hypothetical protein
MTRDEAQRACAKLAAESPDRETHRFLPREDENGDWSIAKVGLPPSTNATGTATEAKPKPPQPDDPRQSHSPIGYPGA